LLFDQAPKNRKSGIMADNCEVLLRFDLALTWLLAALHHARHRGLMLAVREAANLVCEARKVIVLPPGQNGDQWAMETLAVLSRAGGGEEIAVDRIRTLQRAVATQLAWLPAVESDQAAWKLAGGPAAESTGQAGKTTRGKKRGTKPRKPRPITPRQLEVIQTVADCCGNLAVAGRRLGLDRATIEEAYKAGMEKAGKVVYHSKDKTRLLVRDQRGQENVSEGDDRRRQ
jgi:hypothetical protein